MDIADKIYASAPGLCDWLGNMSLSGQLVLAAVILCVCIGLYAMLRVRFGIVVIPDDDEPYEVWMDEALWEECRREERRRWQ